MLALRNAVVSTLQGDLNPTKVQAHDGRLTAASLKKERLLAGMILVATLATSRAEPTAEGVRVNVRMVAYCLAGDIPAKGGQPKLERDAAALALVTQCLPAIEGQVWGLAHADRPANLTAQNLFDGALEAMNLALWAITWDQPLTLGTTDEATLDALNTIYASYDLAETGPDGVLEAEDQVNL